MQPDRNSSIKAHQINLKSSLIGSEYQPSRGFGQPFWVCGGDTLGIRDKPIAPGLPWQNGFGERLIGSIRRGKSSDNRAEYSELSRTQRMRNSIRTARGILLVNRRDEILHKKERAKSKEDDHAAAHSFLPWLEELGVLE